MANKQELESTLLTEEILESLGSREIVSDDETYEDYMDSFIEDEF